MDGSTHSQRTLVLTPEESAELAEALRVVVARYEERSASRSGSGAQVPAGSERVRVYLDAFPLLADDHRDG